MVSALPKGLGSVRLSSFPRVPFTIFTIHGQRRRIYAMLSGALYVSEAFIDCVTFLTPVAAAVGTVRSNLLKV